MKHLKITVNGIPYDVQVEEQDSAAVQTPKPQAQPQPVPAAVPKAAASAPVSAPAAKPAADAEVINSPMPGTIVNIPVQPGQSVQSGDVLLILEAMKMENEIMAPHEAVVDSVLVSKGQSVESGTPLVALR